MLYWIITTFMGYGYYKEKNHKDPEILDWLVLTAISWIAMPFIIGRWIFKMMNK